MTKAGSAAQIRALVAQGAGLGPVCGGESPLGEATLSDNLDAMSGLIEAGADVNLAAGSGGQDPTPIFYAKSARAAQLLVDHGANVNARKKTGETPLIEDADATEPWTYSAEEAAKIAAVLLAHGADVNAVDENGFSALYDALAGKHRQALVAFLLDHGADPDQLAIAMQGEKNARTLDEDPQDFLDYQALLRAHGAVR